MPAEPKASRVAGCVSRVTDRARIISSMAIMVCFQDQLTKKLHVLPDNLTGLLAITYRESLEHRAMSLGQFVWVQVRGDGTDEGTCLDAQRFPDFEQDLIPRRFDDQVVKGDIMLYLLKQVALLCCALHGC